jgi:ATP-binding protein involved in chromosome partitioning
VAKMLGVSDHLENYGDKIIPQNKHGIDIISLATMMSADQPVILRGPMRSKILNQFLYDVEWGNLDYLIADLPPGTGDEVMTMTESLKPNLAVIVTTPQEVSLIDSVRAINMAKKMEITKIGLIENMASLLCPHCNSKINLFGEGGGKIQAKKMDIKFLGSIPIDIAAREAADNGEPIIVNNINNNVSVNFMQIIERIETVLTSDKEYEYQ